MMKVNRFSVGLICGLLVAGSVAVGSGDTQLPFSFPNVKYELDGDGLASKSSGDAPLTIKFNGITYSQTRWLAESLGKEVGWDGDRETVLLNSVESVPFVPVSEEELTDELKQWIDHSRQIEAVQWRKLDGHTYLLYTRGEKSSGGYAANIQHIKQYKGYFRVTVDTSDPPKGTALIQPVTYPYALVRTERPLQGPVSAETEGKAPIPVIEGGGHIEVAVQASDTLVLFESTREKDAVRLRGIASAVQGLVTVQIIGEDGEELGRDIVQLDVAAPNWGRFDISITNERLGKGGQILLYGLSEQSSADAVEEPAAVISFD